MLSPVKYRILTASKLEASHKATSVNLYQNCKVPHLYLCHKAQQVIMRGFIKMSMYGFIKNDHLFSSGLEPETFRGLSIAC